MEQDYRWLARLYSWGTLVAAALMLLALLWPAYFPPALAAGTLGLLPAVGTAVAAKKAWQAGDRTQAIAALLALAGLLLAGAFALLRRH